MNSTPFSPEQTADALGEMKRDQLRTMATGLKIDNARTMGKPDLITAIAAKLREIADVPAPARPARRIRGKVVEFRGTGKRQPRTSRPGTLAVGFMGAKGAARPAGSPATGSGQRSAPKSPRAKLGIYCLQNGQSHTLTDRQRRRLGVDSTDVATVLRTLTD